ncbi:fimbrial protein [Pseudomonas sp. CCC4.1]|uniref:fimbrial protein n=1 Tax=Pseudomonas sp. CCC4.1 TaxID=3048610 RepID=UPI0028D1B832|nr:fimbrial protein [Pseudomonas sp. CCC4.1]MDY7569886.1 fimbrial protein [Pseudomonas sp. CCC4.1]MEB0143957.1 fimbrial protein [Pseudomonas sp. CCC4.1]
MKNLYLAILSLSALAASGATFAEPVTVKGGSGQINFMGFINNDACSVDGSTGKDKVISVDMGNVSIKDMGSDTAPNAGRISANDFNLKVNCNAGTKVSMVFKPSLNGGSGLVTGKKVLKLQGTDAAKGVGIALLDSDGALIDLTSDTTALVTTGLSGEKAVGGDGTLSFAAAYVTTGDAATAVAGTGNATLPFVLQYE